MVERSRKTRLLGPAVMTALGVALLCSLGFWQLQRKAWKEHLIAAIAERTKAEPVELIGAYTATYDPKDDDIGLEYLRVKVRGRFLHDKERYFYAPDPELGPGFNVYTPLQIDGGTAIVFVNRGYVSESAKDPAKRAGGQPAGDVDVIGLVREQGQPGLFTPENDPVHNMWYWRDVNGLAASAFPAGTPNIIPLIVDQEAQTSPGDGPKGGSTIVTLSNRHLEYAITWFGLAITLAAVFAAYATSRLRAKD